VAGSADERDLEAVRKALGEPFASEFSDKVWKIRTNLFVVSFVSLFVVLARLRIEPESTVFGLQFAGLTDEVVRNGLFWVTLYLALHFLWSSFDSLVEWRLRVTGTKLAFVTTGRLASEHADYPNDPRQSTLYHWWSEEARKIGNLAAKAAAIDREMNEWETRLRAQVCNVHANCLNISNAAQSVSGVRERIVELTGAIEHTSKTVAALRIPVSLERFDRWFKLLLKSQNLRWFLIEFLLLLALSTAALVALRIRWSLTSRWNGPLSRLRSPRPLNAPVRGAVGERNEIKGRDSRRVLPILRTHRRYRELAHGANARRCLRTPWEARRGAASSRAVEPAFGPGTRSPCRGRVL